MISAGGRISRISSILEKDEIGSESHSLSSLTTGDSSFPFARSHWITIVVPVSIPPLSDGWNWRKRENWKDTGMSFEDELTDEEEMSSDEDESN